jgi:hypothetical protein
MQLLTLSELIKKHRLFMHYGPNPKVVTTASVV